MHIYLNKTEELFNKYKFDFALLSHFNPFHDYAVFSMDSKSLKKPVYTLYGIYGTLSFLFKNKPEDIFNFPK